MNNNLILDNRARNLILRDKTLEIICEFKKNNIVFLVLKGLYLAFAIYPEPGLRPMVDIDFLVRREDLNSIDEVLTLLGYYEISPKAQRTYGCDITFCHKDNAHYIDIHWDLCQYERFKGLINITDDFWMRACEFKLDGTIVPTLSTEDHILYTAWHCSLVHLFMDKKGIYDIFFIIFITEQIDWKKIVDNASRYGIKIPLYYSLLNASEVTNLKFPDFVWERLRPGFFKKALLDYLILKYKSTPLRYFAQVLMMDTLSGSFKVIWRLLKGMRRAYIRSRRAILK